MNNPLLEAMAWCDGRRELRSLSLEPIGNDWAEMVASVVARRRQLLSGRAGAQSGRLLAFFPDETCCCGGSTVETNGYFDYDNVPPWDTWVRFTIQERGPMLVAWVPEEWIKLVERGIWANPEKSLEWFDGPL